MTSTPKWEEVFNKKFGSRMDTLCRKYVKEALSVTDIKSFIRSTRDEAVRETRKEILATFDEMNPIITNSGVATFRDWLRRLEERKG